MRGPLSSSILPPLSPHVYEGCPSDLRCFYKRGQYVVKDYFFIAELYIVFTTCFDCRIGPFGLGTSG